MQGVKCRHVINISSSVIRYHYVFSFSTFIEGTRLRIFHRAHSMIIHIDLFFHPNRTNVDNESPSTTLGSYLSRATLALGACFY